MTRVLNVFKSLLHSSFRRCCRVTSLCSRYKIAFAFDLNAFELYPNAFAFDSTAVHFHLHLHLIQVHCICI